MQWSYLTYTLVTLRDTDIDLEYYNLGSTP